jgi:hypothetical protein
MSLKSIDDESILLISFFINAVGGVFYFLFFQKIKIFRRFWRLEKNVEIFEFGGGTGNSKSMTAHGGAPWAPPSFFQHISAGGYLPPT